MHNLHVGRCAQHDIHNAEDSLQRRQKHDHVADRITAKHLCMKYIPLSHRNSKNVTNRQHGNERVDVPQFEIGVALGDKTPRAWEQRIAQSSQRAEHTGDKEQGGADLDRAVIYPLVYSAGVIERAQGLGECGQQKIGIAEMQRHHDAPPTRGVEPHPFEQHERCAEQALGDNEQ